MAHWKQENWLRTAVHRAMNPDRFAGNQCVDVVDDYGAAIFAVPWEQCVGGVNGAKDLLRVMPEKYWEKIWNDQNRPDLLPARGDVLVYGGDQWNQFGHTAIPLWVSVSGAQVVQQDGFAEPHQFVDGNWYSAKPAHEYWLGWDQAGTGPILGWARPRWNMLEPPIVIQSKPLLIPAVPDLFV